MGAEIKKGRETCKYLIEGKTTRQGKIPLFCVATSKGRCIYGDPVGFAHCPHYIRYNKSIDELTPKTSTFPRFPS